MLRDRHNVYYVRDIAPFMARFPPEHSNVSNCECPTCELDRTQGCFHPWKCLQTAREILLCIPKKWQTEACKAREDSRRQVELERALEPPRRDAGYFDKSSSTDGVPNDCIRIFTQNLETDYSHQPTILPKGDQSPTTLTITAYSVTGFHQDGSIQAGCTAVLTGTEVFIPPFYARIEGTNTSPITLPGALAHIIMTAMHGIDINTPLEICSES